MNEKPTVAGFFAGVGGIELGFKNAGFNPVWANEIDPHAANTFRLNHSKTILAEGDIYSIEISSIPDVDVIVGGFPCQAFSVAGYRKGFQDPRGEVFFKFAQVIDEKRPKAILLENVKNLKNHDSGNTFSVIKKTLEGFGYYLTSKVLNASEYGNIPQNRERIYIVGFLDKDHAEAFSWPKPIKLTRTIHEIIDSSDDIEQRFFYNEKFPHYDSLVEAIDDPNTVYQWRRQYVRKNKSNLFPTLTANMGTGGHNVPLIKTAKGIRKLTPQECFKVQGFSSLKMPPGMAISHLYKQAGNSVAVPVIQRIASQIKKAISVITD